MTSSYDDPHFEPPAEIAGAEARAYEARVVALLRDAMVPSGLQGIELRGERPETEIILRFRDQGTPNKRVYRFPLWASEYPTTGAAESGSLNEAASVAGWIYSDWSAGDLEPLTSDSDAG